MHTETHRQPRAMLTEEQVKKLISIEGDVQHKAAQLSVLCGEYRINIARVLQHYEPMMAPLRAVVFAGAQQIQHIETQLLWHERIIVLQELRGGSLKLPPHELRAAEEEIMQPVRRAMQDSYQQLSVLTREELAVLRNYECPPEQALTTMAMVMRVRGDEDTEWSTVQAVLSESYFFTFFISRAQTLLRQPLVADVLEALERHCALPEHSPEALARISVPLGAIGQWLYAVRDHYRARAIVASSAPPLAMDERRKTITRLRYELQSVRENVRQAKEKLQDTEQDILRKLVVVRNEYDDTMCSIHDSLEKKAAAFVKVFGATNDTATKEGFSESESGTSTDEFS